jgi:hypothetical protein
MALNRKFLKDYNKGAEDYRRDGGCGLEIY